MSHSFYLIDGHAQIFRAYYAPFADLTSPAGEPTRATYVFTQMLMNLIRDKAPDYLAMAIDVGEVPTFRDRLFAEYKANREAPPEDLQPQIARILQIVESQGIPVLAVPGFEADDLIATITARLAGQDLDLYLVSRDKDLFQLLGERVRLWDPHKDELIDAQWLQTARGYSPQQAVEVQTLVGDTVDNIPGVKGVGEKTAAKLIQKYGTAEQVVARADELTPKQRQNVLAFQEHLPRTRQLVQLRRDVPLEFDLESCRWAGLNPEPLREVFRELGFSRLLDQLEQLAAVGDAPAGRSQPDQHYESGLLIPPPTASYHLVDDPAKLADFLGKLRECRRFAFDTETTGLAPMACDLVGLSFAWQAGQAYYLPVKAAVGRTLDRREVLQSLAPIFADSRIEKCGQNLKYDLVVLRAAGLEVRGVAFDSMIASYLLNSGRRSHGLDHLAQEFLGHTTIPISDLIGKGKAQITIDQVPTERVAEYAGEDAEVSWRLCELLGPQLQQGGLRDLFTQVEMPLVVVLANMEYTGVAIDPRVLEAMSKDLAGRIDELRGRVFQAVGRQFNLDSPKQLAEVLFDELGLASVRSTKTGRSTDAAVLAQLAAETQHPVPGLVLEYRELNKLRSTYVDSLPKMVNPRTGRIHASFNQTATATGRLSSSDPNLQNIPIRTPLGSRIRQAFVPGDDDHVLLTADYSQIELRMLAHFCGDPTLRQAFLDDVDIHAYVASQVFGVPLDQVTRGQRGRAKAVNFGIIYGQTAFGLARSLGIGRQEAQAFIEAYQSRYPGIGKFVDECVAHARRHGYVATILGRRRQIRDIGSRNRQQRSASERMAVNTVVQGSAADLIKVAMINIHRRIHAEQLPVKMLIQVHDELVFEVPKAGVESYAEMIRDQMTTAMALSVPLKVDLAWGPNWLAAK